MNFTALRRALRALEAHATASIIIVLIVLSLLLASGVSHATGPSFAELSRLSIVERMERLVVAISKDGFSALGGIDAQSAYAGLEGKSALGALFAAWSKLSFAPLHVDSLTSVRLPWLLLGALGPAFVFLLMAENAGRTVGLLAALTLATMPSHLHALALGSEDAALGGAWLAVLVCYLRSLGSSASSKRGPERRARLLWALLGASMIGVATACSLFALFIVPIIVLHYWLRTPAATWRLMRKGSVAFPTMVGFSALTVPVLVLALTPPLWATNAAGIAHWLLSPLSPSVTPTLLDARSVSDLPVPTIRYALVRIGFTVPTTVLVAALVGIALFGYRALSRAFASGRLRPPRDRHALGALVVLGISGALIGPALLPAPLVVFPPRVELALPFLAIAAGVGIHGVAQALGRYGRISAALTIAALAVSTLLEPRTLGSAFAPLFGGAAHVAQSRVLAPGDGSEVAILARSIDRLGRADIDLNAPEVPQELWRTLRETGRMRTLVKRSVVPEAALQVVRGPSHGGEPLARVVRDGAVLWTLAQRD